MHYEDRIKFRGKNSWLRKIFDFSMGPLVYFSYIVWKIWIPNLNVNKSVFREVHLAALRNQVPLPNPVNIRTFNDLIRRQMLFGASPEFRVFADKVKSKEWLTSLVGKDYVIPTLGSFESWDELVVSVQGPCVIKASHDSGSVEIITSEGPITDQKLAQKFNSALNFEYGHHTGEWFYFGLKRQLIVEPLLLDHGLPPADYKLHFINGKYAFCQYIYDRFTQPKEHLLDKNWESLPFQLDHRMKPGSRPEISEENRRKMESLGARISAKFEYLRVDFFCFRDKVCIGEITVAPMGGNYKGRDLRKIDQYISNFL